MSTTAYSLRFVLCHSLPLAHVLEFTVEQFAIYLGIPIGYGVPFAPCQQQSIHQDQRV
jgi:hypothetical protein